VANNLNKSVTIWINDRQVTKTIASLQKEMTKTRNELRKMEIGTVQYQQKAAELRKINKILEEHRNELKGVGKDWKSQLHVMGDVGNIMSGVRSFGYVLSGMANSVVQATDEMVKLSDVYGKVRKTTGLTQEEVEALNESFKQMDTRTAREQLNELAYQAGKLGITGKEAVEQFVRASDVINVALGDVLGDDAMITIGKLSSVYEKVTKQMAGTDIETKMRKIGDAVNELGKRSTANEQYIVDFTARLAGVASQAGLSADQVMGFASALDQDMQRVEMSATAFQQLIVQVYRKPEQFAKMAGKSVKEFSEIVKNDMNGALQLILKNMNSAGGMEELVPFLDDVQLAGQRATTIFSDLANNINKVTEAQAIAKQQLETGGSMMAEFDKMNNTAAAQMDKVKKKITDIKEELGNELYPVAVELLNAGGTGLKLITSMVKAVKAYWPALATLAGYYTVLLGLRLKNVAAERLSAAAVAREQRARMARMATLLKEQAAFQRSIAMTVSQTQATKALARAEQLEANATKAANMAKMSTPWGLIVTGASLAAAAIYRLVTAEKRHVEAMKEELSAIKMMDREETEAEYRRLIKDKNSYTQQKSSLQSQIKAYHNGGKYVNEKQYAKYIDNLDKCLRELEPKLEAVRKRKQELDKLESDIAGLGVEEGGGNGYTPEVKEKSNPWDSLIERITKYSEKANAKDLDGLAESLENVKNEYIDLVRAVEGEDVSSLKGGEARKKTLLGELADAYEQMRHAKIDDYIAKLGKEVERFGDRVKTTDDNEYLEKVLKAKDELASNIADIDAAMDVLRNDIASASGADSGQIAQLQDNLNKLYRIRQQMVELGIKPTLDDMKVKGVAPYKRKAKNSMGEIMDRNASEKANAKYNYENELDRLTKLQAAFTAAGDDAGLASVNDAIAQLHENYKLIIADIDKATEKEKWEHLIDTIEKLAGEVGSIFSNINSLLSNLEQTELNNAEQRRDDALEALEEQYEKGAMAQENYEKRKSDIEAEYDAKSKELKLKQWRREKALNISTATMDGIVAVMKTFAQYGWPAGAVLAALQAAASATQIAALAATPKPYAKGGYANEPTILVGEKGQEWVASNRLLSDSSTAPVIAALDAYQKGDRGALARVGMAQPSWGSLSMAASGMNGGDMAVYDLLKQLKDGRLRAVISRREMLDFEDKESFLRSAARY